MPHPWAATPPEINAALLSAGDQAASFTATTAALQTLAGLMDADATSMVANAAETAPSFVGAGGAASLAASSQYAPLAGVASGWLEAGAATVGHLTAAYTTAKNAMVPSEVALGTRLSAEAWAAANWHGFFTPIVTSLYEMYGDQWSINAGAGSGWETSVFAASGPLAIPAPLAPLMGNPVGMGAEAGAASAQQGALSSASMGMQGSFSGLQNAGSSGSHSPAGGSDPGPLEGMQMMTSMASSPLSSLSSATSAFGELPQTLGQLPQMGFGLLGPLLSGSGLSAANPANALSAATEAARQAAATGSLSTGAVTAPMSAFSQPVSSFGSQPASAPRITGSAPGTGAGGPGGATSGTGGAGGLFGAPPGSRRRSEAKTGAAGTPVALMVDGERSQ
ncbi:PPE protein [Mycobacterium lentiflavum]|uniref:PPE protein n=1 Tax=Mycobacterium lentiflavum TaxID=141349 RepID=A0A0E4CRE2_MYCLN|nr:PPE domain-containing protein [Mycobacterium lentiflavum]CQD24181.1 PPE protein [Mycobacterium lentiflavum]